MNEEGSGREERSLPPVFGAPFAPRNRQRQAGIAEEQLSASAETRYPPQVVEIKKIISVPIWSPDARILTGRGVAEIGNALGRCAAGRGWSNGPKIALSASKFCRGWTERSAAVRKI
jgi:hypothetical protein